MQAQHKFGNTHLYWHTEQHCWDDVPVGKATRRRYQPPPLSHEEAERSAEEQPAAEIMFPTVRISHELPEPRPVAWSRFPWFSPWSMTGWPLIYDFDEPEKFAPWTRRIE